MPRWATIKYFFIVASPSGYEKDIIWRLFYYLAGPGAGEGVRGENATCLPMFEILAAWMLRGDTQST